MFKCSTCGTNFGLKEHLQRHIKDVHQLARPFPCPDCGQSFARKADMERHRASVHQGVRYPCTWRPPPGDPEELTHSCDKSFSTKDHLSRHIRMVHTQRYRIICEICDDQGVLRSFYDNLALKRHKLSKHPREYEVELQEYNNNHPYVCKYSRCKKRFKTEVERSRHQEKLH